jgi:acyl transferase domain-containing protein
MSFEDGLKLVKLRGESMQAAADAVRSGMVSVIGLDKEKVAALCEAATAEVRGAVHEVLGRQCMLLGACCGACYTTDVGCCALKQGVVLLVQVMIAMQ